MGAVSERAPRRDGACGPESAGRGAAIPSGRFGARLVHLTLVYDQAEGAEAGAGGV